MRIRPWNALISPYRRTAEQGDPHIQFSKTRVGRKQRCPVCPSFRKTYIPTPRYNSNNGTQRDLAGRASTPRCLTGLLAYQMINYLDKSRKGQPVAVYTLGSKLTLLQDLPAIRPAVLRNHRQGPKGKVSTLAGPKSPRWP